MKTKLLYRHNRNLFINGRWKNWVNKYFKDVEFLGFEYGYYYPSILISNWNEVKDILPQSYKPLKIINNK